MSGHQLSFDFSVDTKEHSHEQSLCPDCRRRPRQRCGRCGGGLSKRCTECARQAVCEAFVQYALCAQRGTKKRPGMSFPGQDPRDLSAPTPEQRQAALDQLAGLFGREAVDAAIHNLRSGTAHPEFPNEYPCGCKAATQ